MYELSIPEAMVKQAAQWFGQCPQLGRCLSSPCVTAEKKHAIIQRVFSQPAFSVMMVRFLKKACDAGCIGQMEDIARIYQKLQRRAAGILEAELVYVTMPDEAQIAGIKKFLCERYGMKDVELTFTEDAGLMGGFVLRTGDEEYDYSLKGQLNQLREAVAG